MNSYIDIRVCVLWHFPHAAKANDVSFIVGGRDHPAILEWIMSRQRQLCFECLFANVLACMVNLLYLCKQLSKVRNISAGVKVAKMNLSFTRFRNHIVLLLAP